MSFAFFIRVLGDDKDRPKPGLQESKTVSFYLGQVCADLSIDLRTGESFNSVGLVTAQIKEALERADVIFAEVSAPNANVWYEVGYSDRINEGKVVILCRKGEAIPFDRAHQRTFIYDPDDHAAIVRKFDEVKDAAREIISVSAIYRLILGDRPEQAIPEYIQNSSGRTADCVDTLRAISRDVERSAGVRKVALHVLGRLGSLTGEEMVSLSRPLTEEGVRQEVFALVESSPDSVPDEVWLNAARERSSVRVMRSAARAGGRHFALGLISEEVSERVFLNSKRWETRKHFLISLLESCNDGIEERIVEAASRLILDDAEEVTNRFVDWMKDIVPAEKRNDTERQILSLIAERHPKLDIREKAEALSR